MCLNAMSSDFFEIVLPNPVLSAAEASLVGLRNPPSDEIDFWISGAVAAS